jgi:hypothetical protein
LFITSGRIRAVFFGFARRKASGDFNSDAESNDASYQLLLTAGFTDVWKQTHPNEPGFTWALFLTDPYTYTAPFQRLI